MSPFKAAKALAAKSVCPFKIKKAHAPHLHLPAALGGGHLMGKHPAGTADAAGMDNVAGATKEHGAAAALQARFRGRRCLGKLPFNAAGTAGPSEVPKEKHRVAATLLVPHLHLHLPTSLSGRRLASKHPVGASEADGKAATTLL